MRPGKGVQVDRRQRSAKGAQHSSDVPSQPACTLHIAAPSPRSCLPKFPPGLASQFVDATLGTLTSASLNNSRDRLQRYITDIGRGLYIISAAGTGGLSLMDLSFRGAFCL